MFIASYYFNWQCGQNKKASRMERLSSEYLSNSKVVHNLQWIDISADIESFDIKKARPKLPCLYDRYNTSEIFSLLVIV